MNHDQDNHAADRSRTALEPIYRRNFLFFLLDNICFNLTTNILGPTTVIPDFLRRLTQSEVLIGLSSNLFDVGSTLPQLFIARYIIRFRRMKWWFVLPNIPGRLAIIGIAVLIFLIGKDNPQGILVAFFVCYITAAVGNGITNVPIWVMFGSSLDNRWRSRVLGFTSAIVGVLMLGISPLVGLVLSDSALTFPNNYGVIFGAAGILFALAILPVIFVHELPSNQAVDKIPSFAEFLPKLGSILRTDLPFRAMIIIRVLTSLFAMASPFYIGFATIRLGLSSTVAVPTLLATQTLGGVCGALLFAWLAARSTVLYMRLAQAMALIVPISALLAGRVGPLPLYIGFLVLGLTLGNLFASYHNWVISYAMPQQRAIYAGLFNTIGGVFGLVIPLIGGTIAQHLGYELLFVVALLTASGALYVTLRYIPSRIVEPPSTIDADKVASTDHSMVE